MTIDEIVSGVEGIELRSGESLTPIESITYDSRQVGPGGLFVALRGELFDGHKFVDSAIEQGAAAILVEKGHHLKADVPILEASDTRAVLADLGTTFYRHPSRQMKVIGITGTNGKTTTSYLLEGIFRAAGFRTGVIGTVEYRWAGRRVAAPNTTPDGLVLQRILRQMADDDVDVAILEVSSHGLESGRVRGVDFDAALFTNLSQDHLDFHPNMEAYRDAKRRLFLEYLPASSGRPAAVINVDDEEGRALVDLLRTVETVETVAYGLDEGQNSDFQGLDLEMELQGISFSIEENSAHTFEISAPLPGRFNAENVLGVVALARTLGVEVEQLRNGLDQSDQIPGRMQRVESDGPAVFVDYAHTPDALRRALDTLRPVTKGRLWVVFGCGGDRDRLKRPIMGEVASRCADEVVLTSDNPRREDPEAIIDSIASGMAADNYNRFSDREEAIDFAIGRAGAFDVILIAGKGHETTQEVDGKRRVFDDRAVARKALQRRGE